MKKVISVLTVTLALLLGTTVFAQENITVMLNNEKIEFDVPPTTVNGRTMVPVRAIFEALDATVSWDGETQKITATKGHTTIIMHLNNTVMTVNDTEVILDTAPFETGGRTLVPARAISEAFKCKVLWEESTQTVHITSQGYTPAEISQKASPAVFIVVTMDENYNPSGIGSGFFINKNGTAITNYHVLDGCDYAGIKMTDDTILGIDKILYADKTNDFIIFNVLSDRTDFPYLELGDSDSIYAGQKIFALGSPKGFDNTLSEGIISNTDRIINEKECFQITAPVSPGSSGGAALNEYCEVIGIPTIKYTDGESLNFCIPINILKDVEYYNPPKTLADLPKDYALFEFEKEYVRVKVGNTASIPFNIYSNIEEGYITSEFVHEGFASIDISNGIGEYDYSLNITGLSQGTTAIFIGLNEQNNYVVFIDVYSTSVPTYYEANIATYMHITGDSCLKSFDTATGKMRFGYEPEFDKFQFKYDYEKLNLYIDYLERNCFFEEGISIEKNQRVYVYDNYFNKICLTVDTEKNLLYIQPYYNY